METPTWFEPPAPSVPAPAHMELPPGYRLTKAAQARVDALGLALNRHERRALLAQYRRRPLSPQETLEKIP